MNLVIPKSKDKQNYTGNLHFRFICYYGGQVSFFLLMEDTIVWFHSYSSGIIFYGFRGWFDPRN